MRGHILLDGGQVPEHHPGTLVQPAWIVAVQCVAVYCITAGRCSRAGAPWPSLPQLVAMCCTVLYCTTAGSVLEHHPGTLVLPASNGGGAVHGRALDHGGQVVVHLQVPAGTLV